MRYILSRNWINWLNRNDPPLAADVNRICGPMSVPDMETDNVIISQPAFSWLNSNALPVRGMTESQIQNRFWAEEYKDGKWVRVPAIVEPEAEKLDPILLRANQLINGERRNDYGHPAKNFDDIARMWSVILDKPIEPKQVILCMIALKSCRLAKSLDHMDSWMDIAGYVGCAELIEQGETK